MCGRYTLTTPLDVLRALFGFEGFPNLAPRYNVCPTQEAPIVRPTEAGGRELVQMRWGPPQGEGRGPLINARAETVARLPLFKDSFLSRRCLVPADGFYEWRKENGNNQPFRIGFKGGIPFAFAGIWCESGFTLVTTDANAKLAPIHHRMPVIVAAEDYATWLDAREESAGAAHKLLRAFPQDSMAFYRVGPHVNSARRDDPTCIVPLRAA
jgi:putative SOS response-associated peptidase YedK